MEMCENKESMSVEKEVKKQDRINVTDIDIILTNRFPNYYEIKYKKVGEQEYRTGFGSYNLDLVTDWKEKNFELVTEEEQGEVINEELLKHLKELEIATGAIANGINTLFYIIDGKRGELHLGNEEKRMIVSGMLALTEITKRMNKVSGLKEESEKIREQKEKLMKEILKELFE